MSKMIWQLLIILASIYTLALAQDFSRFDFLLGSWEGTGSGFGNETSVIISSYKLEMNNTYLKIENHSEFKPTESKPEGEIHEDWGIVSFDQARGLYVYRQFNNEGYVNQYILNDSLSTDKKLVFETEIIENFVPGGSARSTIENTGHNTIKTTFDVSFPGKGYTCFGENKLQRLNR